MFYEWRIKNFNNEFPREDFPSYVQFNGEIRQEYNIKICKIVDIPERCASNDDFFIRVRKSLNFEKMNEPDCFDLGIFLDEKKIKYEKKLILYYIDLDDVFEFDALDIFNKLDNLYYSGPDNIFIFDESFQWIICLDSSDSVGCSFKGVKSLD